MRVCLIAVASLLLSSPVMAQSAEQPGLSEIWQAAWRHEHTVGSFLSNKMHDADLDTVDQTFAAWEEARDTKYESFPDQLGRLRTREVFEVWKSQIDREQEDRRTLGVDR